MEEAVAAFYESVENLVSEDFYNTMLANRDIMKYDELAHESGYALAPTGFDFTEYSKTDGATTYAFTAHLLKTSGGESVTGAMEGQITVRQSGQAPLITNLYLLRLGFVPDP